MVSMPVWLPFFHPWGDGHATPPRVRFLLASVILAGLLLACLWQIGILSSQQHTPLSQTANLVPHLTISIKCYYNRNLSVWFMLLALISLVTLWHFVERGFLPGSNGANSRSPVWLWRESLKSSDTPSKKGAEL